ncbi:hypothetical protein N8I74_04915 [Chitiniphilus purpureus]|uniref:Uncharacterized protein n=1 Tax=Chitiniphilus purpureus TaxID=2981137 RepID=A0ABY6DPR3_9NEIS|nr:hypothetical protein [Chitiniphilus sp. CD1]UXY16364.1 hypothetical protein N8I74_04915 [Chitiniphilus sp. CD1]
MGLIFCKGEEAMSWRTGSTVFVEIWPVLEAHITDEEERDDIAVELINVFERRDMDVNDLLNSFESLDGLLERQFGLSEKEECFTGFQSENSLLMQLSRNIAQTLNLQLQRGEDGIHLSGRIGNTNCVLHVSLYNFADRNYQFDVQMEAMRFDPAQPHPSLFVKRGRSEVDAPYDPVRKAYIKDDINHDNLLRVAMAGIDAVINGQGGWSDPEVVPFYSNDEAEIQPALARLPKANVQIDESSLPG